MGQGGDSPCWGGGADPVVSFVLIFAVSQEAFLSPSSSRTDCLCSLLFSEFFAQIFPDHGSSRGFLLPAPASVLDHLPLLWAAPGRCSWARSPVRRAESRFPPWKDMKNRLQRSNSQPCRHGAGEGHVPVVLLPTKIKPGQSC